MSSEFLCVPRFASRNRTFWLMITKFLMVTGLRMSPHRVFYLAEMVIYAGLLVANGGQDLTVWLLFAFVGPLFQSQKMQKVSWNLFKQYGTSYELLCQTSSQGKLAACSMQVQHADLSRFQPGCCYSKPVLVLQSVAGLRSCVRLDLESDSLDSNTFDVFQSNIRSMMNLNPAPNSLLHICAKE